MSPKRRGAGKNSCHFYFSCGRIFTFHSSPVTTTSSHTDSQYIDLGSDSAAKRTDWMHHDLQQRLQGWGRRWGSSRQRGQVSKVKPAWLQVGNECPTYGSWKRCWCEGLCVCKPALDVNAHLCHVPMEATVCYVHVRAHVLCAHENTPVCAMKELVSYIHDNTYLCTWDSPHILMYMRQPCAM